MTTARIKILSEDKLDEIRDSVATYLATVPPSHIINQTPISVYEEFDKDRRFIVALSHHDPGAVDEEGQLIISDTEKVHVSQADVDSLLSKVRHHTLTGDTTVANTVTVIAAMFAAGDVGRSVESGGEIREIDGFVSETEVTYSGDPLPSSASVDVHLLGAESLRSVSLDTYRRDDHDPRIIVAFVPGGGIAAGAGDPAGGTTLNTIEVSNDYTVQPGIDFVAVDASAGPVNITMPPAVDGERKIHVKKIDASANKVTVLPDGTDNIDGFAGFDILFQNNSYIFVSNKVDTWWVT